MQQKENLFKKKTYLPRQCVQKDIIVQKKNNPKRKTVIKEKTFFPSIRIQIQKKKKQVFSGRRSAHAL